MIKFNIPANISIPTKSEITEFSFSNFILSTLMQSEYFTTYTTLLHLEQFITLFQNKNVADEVEISEDLLKILKELLISIKFDSPQKGLLVLPWMKYVINL